MFDSANGVFLIQTNDGATWWDRLTLEAINYDLRPEGNDQAINVRLIPTGTGERSQLQLLSASDPANTDVFRLDRDEANDEWVIQATKVGSGVVRPININITGVGDVLRVDTSGNLILPNGNYLELLEMAAPGAGGANTVRIYAVEDGGTLTDLAAVFQDGTVDIFAQEV
ncbi:MAG: hypothetical protein GWN58_28520 [Anaerolineae bacterium]|nr:hypothetical protein [Anaerolineae bacterium]